MYSFETPAISSDYSGSTVWMIVSLVLAIIGGIVLCIMFNSKNVKFTDKYLIWIKDFFNFKHLTLSAILKLSYAILAIYVTLSSFGLISISFVAFLVQLILGNIILRIIFEMALLLITICKNTTEINNKLKNKKDN